MLTEQECRSAAEGILRAERERVPVVQLSKSYRNMEIRDAYRVQDFGPKRASRATIAKAVCAVSISNSPAEHVRHFILVR